MIINQQFTKYQSLLADIIPMIDEPFYLQAQPTIQQPFAIDKQLYLTFNGRWLTIMAYIYEYRYNHDKMNNMVIDHDKTAFINHDKWLTNNHHLASWK